jgi:hypothetical protein
MLVTVTGPPVVENPTTKITKQGIMTESATAETKADATAVEEEEPTQKEEETAANNSDEAMKNNEEPKEGEETKEGEKKEEAEEEKKKPKIDPKDWPLRDIKEPCDNDVLFGRGGR